MQDYIFDSRRRAAQRRKRSFIRLLLLVAILVAAAYAANLFLNKSSSSTPLESPALKEDSLALPPADDNASNTKNSTPNNSEISLTPPAEAPVAAGDVQASSQTSDIPVAQPAIITEEIVAPPSIKWTERKIKQGESLASIFKKQSLTPKLLHHIVNSSDTAKELAHIRPGQTLRFGFDNSGELAQLVLQRNKISSLHITTEEDTFTAVEQKRDVDIKQATAKGILESSLFVDGQKAGLADSQIMELAGIFGWDIDFALEIRSGDSFSLIYEEQYLDSQKYRNGPILAAEFINKGTVYRALRYLDEDGNAAYFDPEGRSKKRAFIRTPVKFARISSGFNPKRWHPVLKRWRSHKGVDYAARKGTPVKATGNGRITFMGRKGGYGKAIFIRHGGKYTTVYGHLSKFSRKLKNGSKVKQDQIIGYVGSTGLATGPHLHYEFRVNGVHRNPLTVKLPKSNPLPKKKLKDFQEQTGSWLTALNEMTSQKMIATASQLSEP